MTQAEVADRTHVSQRRVSGIESGDIERTQVTAIRRHAEAAGGTLRVEVEVEVEVDGDRYELA